MQHIIMLNLLQSGKGYREEANKKGKEPWKARYGRQEIEPHSPYPNPPFLYKDIRAGYQ